jgi:hypothetical protein
LKGNASVPVASRKGNDNFGEKSGGKLELKPGGQIQTGPKCMNTLCNGYHRLKDCPITDKKLAKRLLKEYMSKQHEETQITGKVNRVQSRLTTYTTEILLRSKYAVDPDGDDDFWAAVFPEAVEARLRADCGSTAGCFMSMSVAKKIVASGKARFVELTRPMQLAAAADKV